MTKSPDEEPAVPRSKQPAVAIFRQQLFVPSEPFIAMQSEAMTRHEPVYVGRQVQGPGPHGRSVVTPSSTRAGQLHLITGSGRPWSDQLRSSGITIVHAHFGPDGLLARSLAKDLGVPLAVTLHGFDVTRTRQDMLKSNNKALMRYALASRLLAKDAAVFLCVSTYIRERAIERGFPPNKLRVHHIGNPLGAAGQVPADRSTSSVVHVARLVEKKGTATLLRAFADVVTTASTATLEIVGDGPLRPSLEALVGELNIGDRVTFHGALGHEEVLTVIRRSSVLCLPSITAADGDAEGLGMVMLEAAQVGTAVVASNSGGIPDFVIDGKTGLLAEPGDAASLARQLTKVLQDPHLRADLVRGANEKLESDFNLGTQTSRLEDVFEELTAR